MDTHSLQSGDSNDPSPPYQYLDPDGFTPPYVGQEIPPRMRKFQSEQQNDDVSTRNEFKDKTPFSIMFIFRESIVQLILPEYFTVLIINLFVSFLIGLQPVKRSGFLKFLSAAAKNLDSFPEEIIVFLLGFCIANISAARSEMFSSSIPFIEDFAFSLRTNIPKNPALRQRLLDLANQMIVGTFSTFEDDVKFDRLKRLFPGNFGEWVPPIGKEDGSIYTDPYLYAMSILDKAGEHKTAIKDDVMSLVKKCRNLLQYNFKKPPFQNISTTIICCNIYLVHIFLDLIPFDNTENYFGSLLSFTIRFFIFYGWPKVGINEYYAIGKKESGGKFNLYQISVRNIIVGHDIIHLA